MSTDLIETNVSESLSLPPIYDSVNAQKLALLQSTVAAGATAPEIAMFLELAQRYDLDPFAKEIWCAISDRGQSRKVMIMIARDGLRKIAQRNGLRIDGDVIRENDHFVVSRGPDRSRTIEHAYADARASDSERRSGVTSQRGKVTGAWAEVWDEATGVQRGFFYADVKEYKPTSENSLRYSPWGSQESVMVLSAAERQALRQATPLSGLLVQGEMDLNLERLEAPRDDALSIRELVMSLDAPEGVRHRLWKAIEQAQEVAPGSFGLGKAQMTLIGRDEDGLIEQAVAIERQNAEIVRRRPAPPVPDDVVEAEVVDDGGNFGSPDPLSPELRAVYDAVCEGRETPEEVQLLHDTLGACEDPDDVVAQLMEMALALVEERRLIAESKAAADAEGVDPQEAFEPRPPEDTGR